MKDFLTGVIFISLALPCIEGIVTVFNQGLECICTRIAVKTYELKKTLQEEPEEETRVIGFQVPSYDDEEEE